MRISESWLREWVNPKIDSEGLAHQLTMAGLEVDAIEPVAGVFSHVVVAEITGARPHPDADKLQVCTVNDGSSEPVQIVCGAPNARVGLKAPLARVGAVLPGGFAIKEAELRGQLSQGMLCAASELELSDDKQGLLELPADAPVGESLRDYLRLDDHAIEIGLTPNRSDCLSIRGVAREVAVINRQAFTEPDVAPVSPVLDTQLNAELNAPGDCPRYLCRVIEGVDLSGRSPVWLQEKLRRCGVRSIDPAVDVTNYILLELGQPMHAFDLDKVQGGIVVRKANSGEKITLLNDQEIELTEDNLVIADHGRALALAGIMGGSETAVSAGTTRILLESAFFAPVPLSGKAREFGLHTDSSHRYERGVDYDLQRKAMERATALLLEVAGGKPGPVTEAVSESDMPEWDVVRLRRARIPRLLGVEIDDGDVERMLDGLGVEFTRIDDGWQCRAPSWRFDLNIEADFLEEVGRLYGYNNLPTTRIQADVEMQESSESNASLRSLRRTLLARDFHEAITYSFVDREIQEQLAPDVNPIALSNPISPEHAVMRTTLLGGLLRAGSHNVNRQQARVRLFETGLRFQPGADGLVQTPALALLVTGGIEREAWSNDIRPVDFFDVKGVLESLTSTSNLSEPLSFVPAQHPGLHPGQTARILRGERELGVLGVVHPSLQQELDFESTVVVAEVDLHAFLEAKKPSFEPISRFPALRRDIAVVVDQSVSAGSIIENVRAQAGAYLKDLTLFDVYQGKGIDPQRKSLALGLTFQDQSRTLADDEINTSIRQVVDSLKENYNAELRS
ncbi:MAG: phenylalanine--tRNA ligase subunit beta [Pseudomonadota bacterium]